MAINAQFPSWITESRIAEAQLGQQMGRNILEGLRFQEQKRQAAEEQRRYDALAPMRTAQMELMRARTTQEILDAEKQREALNVENRFNANQVEALRFQEGIARSAGNYSSPENEASFYRFLSKNPDFTRTEWAKKMQENFKLGRENAFKADQLELENSMRLKQIEKAADVKTGYIQKGPSGTMFQGTPDQIKKMQEQFPELLQNQDLSPATTVSKDPLTGEDRITYRFPKGTPPEAIRAFLGQGDITSDGIYVPAPGAPKNKPGQPLSYKNFILEGAE